MGNLHHPLTSWLPQLTKPSPPLISIHHLNFSYFKTFTTTDEIHIISRQNGKLAKPSRQVCRPNLFPKLLVHSRLVSKPQFQNSGAQRNPPIPTSQPWRTEQKLQWRRTPHEIKHKASLIMDIQLGGSCSERESWWPQERPVSCASSEHKQSLITPDKAISLMSRFLARLTFSSKEESHPVSKPSHLLGSLPGVKIPQSLLCDVQNVFSFIVLGTGRIILTIR